MLRKSIELWGDGNAALLGRASGQNIGTGERAVFRGIGMYRQWTCQREAWQDSEPVTYFASIPRMQSCVTVLRFIDSKIPPPT